MTISTSSILRTSFAAIAALILLVVSQSAGSISAATLNVDGSDGGCSDLAGTPYCTIGAAVGDATPGDVINVFPGTYAERVDVDTMDTNGNITFQTVDSSGTPTPGTVTVNPGTAGDEAFTTACSFPGDITIDGFNFGFALPANAIELCASGAMTIRNVTANDSLGLGVGLFGPGSATVENTTANNAGSDGVEVDVNGNVSIVNATANGNTDDGFDIYAGGNVTINGSDADGNGTEGGDGFDIYAGGNVTIDESGADENQDYGFEIGDFDTGTVTITDSHANGNLINDGFDVDAHGVTITNATANDNGDEGIQLDIGGDVVLDRVTANNNSQHPENEGGDGLDIEALNTGCEESCPPIIDLVDSIKVTNSVFIGNGSSGVDFDGDGDNHEPSGTYLVNGNIICENTTAGFSQNSEIHTDATGNWWGDASGPEHPKNPTPGTGDKVLDGVNPTNDDGQGDTAGTTDFEPWIDFITVQTTNSVTGVLSSLLLLPNGSSADPPPGYVDSLPAVTQGQPTTVDFMLMMASGPSLLVTSNLEGPGNPNGDPTFAVTTDNGTVSTSGFVENSSLEATLVPETAGTATVALTGPCGLDGGTGGNTVVLDVVAAPVAPTATPAQLPASGGEPTDGGRLNAALLVITALALLGVGSGFWLVHQRRPTR